MHCHCGTNYRAPRWAFTDSCKPEVRPGAREESASPAWLAAPAMNARDTTKVYIWRLDIGCGRTLYRKYHSHNTPGKRHNNTWVEPLAGNCTTSSTPQHQQCRKSRRQSRHLPIERQQDPMASLLMQWRQHRKNQWKYFILYLRWVHCKTAHERAPYPMQKAIEE